VIGCVDSSNAGINDVCK